MLIIKGNKRFPVYRLRIMLSIVRKNKRKIANKSNKKWRLDKMKTIKIYDKTTLFYIGTIEATYNEIALLERDFIIK